LLLGGGESLHEGQGQLLFRLQDPGAGIPT
jgi:hypothetical protein